MGSRASNSKARTLHSYEDPRGPTRGSCLSSTRVTRGTFSNGEDFVIVDNWKSKDCAHRLLAREWTGSTSFVEVSADEEVRQLAGHAGVLLDRHHDAGCDGVEGGLRVHADLHEPQGYSRRRESQGGAQEKDESLVKIEDEGREKSGAQKGHVSYAEICRMLRSELPALAQSWSEEFPELRT